MKFTPIITAALFFGFMISANAYSLNGGCPKKHMTTCTAVTTQSNR